MMKVTDVPTGKMNNNGADDISDKVVIGAIHAGLGYTHVRNFLSALNLPVMSKSCFQRHEKKIGRIITEVAEEFCSRVRELEKELSGEQDYGVSFDGAWQKRGSGFNYNSLTGHAAMIGTKSQKVTCFDIRSKCCKMCQHYERKELPVPKHDCQRNWYGSSKAMEPDLAVTLAHKMEDCGYPISVIHADNDSTTMVKLKMDYPNITKKDYQNHTIKGITKSLFELSKRHKDLKPAEVIPYLNRCFMYAITQNQDDDTEIDNAFSRIVPHVYGEHDLCEDVDWCTYQSDPLSFNYKSLPEGKPLTDPLLRHDLEELIGKYRKKSDSLKNLGSTQANESFNNAVAVHAPKNRHYGGSQSLKSRVSSTVLQKNEGTAYLEQVNEAAMLSPGDLTKKMSEILDKEMKERRERKQTKEVKKRRSQLKKERKKKERLSTVTEPISYQSNLDVTGLSEVDKISIPTSPLQFDGDESFVFYDLETTSLKRTCDILQIAAVCNSTFLQHYALPRCEISVEASKITGITCSLAVNKMYVKGKEVPYKSQYEVLLIFIDFLKQLHKPVLVGHNISRFDIVIISNRLKEFGLFSTFKDIIKGYIDTLTVAKRVFHKTEVENYKQASLVMKFVGNSYEAHNAVEDVKSLKQLYEQEMKGKVNNNDLFSVSYSTCRATFDTLNKEKVISGEICNRLSRNGISLLHLKAALQRDPKGISALLQTFKISSSKSEKNLVAFFAIEQ